MKSIANASEGKTIADFLTQQQSFYAGILDKVPEAFRAELQKLKDGIDAKLAALAAQPTDQVPAAQEAACGLEHMAMSLSWMQEMYDSATKGLADLMERLAPKEQALHALESRITSGELVEKTAADAALQAAVDAAVKQERDAFALLTSRRQMLASASLPIPSGDAVLSGDDAAFEARRKTAKERHEKLVSMGVCQQLESAELADIVYGGDKEWHLFVKIAGRGRQVAEPLAGGSAEQPKTLRGY